VLSVLKEEDTYGYLLTQTLRESLSISESTLYPVLRRLQKEQFLSTYDEPFQGRNRRYYSITERGRRMVDEYKKEWQIFRDRVDLIIMKGGKAA
jgi:PadR family transcriptional regulator PadR